MNVFDAVLDDRFLLGRGAHRSTYSHPDDDSKLIKVVHYKGRERARNRKRFWSMGRRLDMDGNERELRSIELLKNAGQYDSRFFPAFFGSIETNLGPGLVFEKLGSGHEEQIYDLKVLEQKKIALELLSKEQILEQYDELIAFFVMTDVPNVGLGIENLAVLDRPGHSPQLMCFDLKFLEDRSLVPAADLFSWVSRRRVKRLLERAKTKFSVKLGGHS
ncbi:YrbL family protein [Pararhizobium sp. IMCC21322]|uniref:YrbL family protein n=1 Tax=Pararhizobium sp. IMCC21322 TaxID=3067903 RepID=UPI002741458D|nr:YrbL family protein [Pararhizobium sp. IMCC21322]